MSGLRPLALEVVLRGWPSRGETVGGRGGVHILYRSCDEGGRGGYETDGGRDV